MYIPRHLENVVRRIAQRKPVIVLTGARQVGKSTMLKTTWPELGYVALNSPLTRQSALDNPSSFFDDHRPPVIVDEIQKVGALFDYVKERVDEEDTKGQYFLTGSQSLQLMRNVGESLAGRAGIVKMLGLSLRELDGVPITAPFVPTPAHLSAMKENAPPFDYNKIIERIHTGSFPELHGTPGDLHDWADYHSSYLQTYLEKDIRDALQIQDKAAVICMAKQLLALTGTDCILPVNQV